MPRFTPPKALPLLASLPLIASLIVAEASAQTDKRVLMIGIDGAGGRYLPLAETPHLDALLAAGTGRLDFLNEGALVPNPPEPFGASGVNWSTIVTGASAATHGVTDNSFAGSNLARVPHWFTYLKQHDPTLFTASIVNWAPINDQLLPDQDADLELEFSGLPLDVEDALVRDATVDLLTTGDPSAIFLHFDQVDGAGHAHSWGSPNHLAAITTVDTLIGDIIEALHTRPGVIGGTEDWLVLVTADHGAEPGSTGHFASQGLSNWEVPLIVSGPSVTPAAPLPQGSLRDLAATALWHMGIDPFPTAVEGQIVGIPILPPNAIAGDINQDGLLRGDGTGPAETDDVTAFLNGWFTSGHASATDAYAAGDLNLDRKTDLADWILFRQLDPQMAAAAMKLLLVPEPTGTPLALALALASLAGGGGRRRPARQPARSTTPGGPGRRSRSQPLKKTTAFAGLPPLATQPIQARSFRWTAVGVLTTGCWLGPVGHCSAQQILFFEDFSGVQLGPNVHETLNSSAAWTDTPPSGWAVDDSGVPSVNVPTAGVAEWEGWSFADKAWWIAAAQDQRRSEFTLGEGVVAVADPDEWDDRGSPAATLGFFNAWMTTPPIAIGSVPSTIPLSLRFASSWRDECCDEGPLRNNNQTAVVRVRFDQAPPQEILRWESDPASPAFKNDAPNETVAIRFERPAGASLATFEFGLLEAGNDWWWAVDNVTLTADFDSALRATIDRDTGEITIVNRTGADQPLEGYQFTSSSGAFDRSRWTPISGRLDGAGDQSIATDRWLIATQPGATGDLSELSLGGGVLPANASIRLGSGTWGKYFADTDDVTFSYSDGQSSFPIDGVVEFLGNDGRPFQFGDLNFDGTLDADDWRTLRRKFGMPLATLSEAARYRASDLDRSGTHDLDDIRLFIDAFDAFNGTGAFALMSQTVPEPTSAACLAAMCLAAACSSRRRRPRPRPRPRTRKDLHRHKSTIGALFLAAATLLLSVPAAPAAILFQENFDSLPLGPSVDEGLTGGTVWTKIAPPGWTIDDSGVPDGGVTEWRGWSFANPAWWSAAAGDQGRSQFTKASGVVAIADPDEWDDLPRQPGFFNSLLNSPPIPLGGLAAGAAKLRFDSSWQPEAFQRAVVRASFDGGPPVDVLTYSSILGDPNYKPAALNESVVVDLDNPAGAATVRLQFGLLDAGNNWWWGIDNLELFTSLTLEVDLTSGELRLPAEAGLRIRSYEISSPAGSLQGSAWASSNLASRATGAPQPAPADFDGNLQVDSNDLAIWQAAFAQNGLGDATGDGQTQGDDLLQWQREFADGPAAGSTWNTLLATNHQLIEAYLLGSTPLDGPISLGTGYRPQVDARDLSFRYLTSDGESLEGAVRYVGGVTAQAVPEPTALWLLLLGTLSAATSVARRSPAR
jgi:hypothetical protein